MNRGCFLPKAMIKPVEPTPFLYNVMLLLLHFSVLLLDGEQWNCPLGSSLCCSDYAYKASRKLGKVNRGQAVLQAVKQLCVWLKTNIELEHKHPSRLSSCAQPSLLHRQPWWTRGSQQLGQDGGEGDSFMTKQNCWKLFLHGASKWRCTESEYVCAASQTQTNTLNSSLIQLGSYFHRFFNSFLLLMITLGSPVIADIWEQGLYNIVRQGKKHEQSDRQTSCKQANGLDRFSKSFHYEVKNKNVSSNPWLHNFSQERLLKEDM